ncbi:CpsD/CapB family tyrosine-protein kinase [Sinorhizobium medicae]|uniref:Chromosome partitioning protein n=1 Tax=Sinorhizobium medicae TaxID=110321 RepID=A0ABX4TG10_9HYPH|nr:CpsD/CapB family tyrosine-protein kinase [Sinorhizobium medicae]MBO1960879.1 CpsD/CapB family tyrosine-protein kinase [Sinorhizobium medicae]MDX0456652.1 P-loop NTPase [Sinorhizobium medicae]MDX0514065.1 P-loop NTPase [Sinorhizobium medicae]MDX0693342.1 P-loop NTPase [Sinorhizobium medicae]MDX0724460.1 P-loop NTPase [Sinorhizobium medicae]
MEHAETTLHEFPEAERLSRIGAEPVWKMLSPCRADPRSVAGSWFVTTGRSNPKHAAFDMLRTKLLLALQQKNWKTVAITSPTPGCGKTFVALNLAFSLANQKDCRTVLVDLDLKRPQIAKTLGIEAPSTIEKYLKGESEIGDVFQRYSDNLAIGASKQAVPFSAELLQNRGAVKQLQEMQQKMNPDVVLFDMPPMLSNDDVVGFLPNVDCVILIAASEQSTLAEVDICEQELSERTNVLGVVLNKCRFAPEKYGY